MEAAGAMPYWQVPPLWGSIFLSLLEYSFVYVGALSLCKSDMCTFIGSFLITPIEIDIHQNS